MSLNQQAQAAEIFEKSRLSFALLIFLAGVNNGELALEIYYSQQGYVLLHLFHNVLGITMIVMLFLVLIHTNRFLKISPCGKRQLLDEFVYKINLTAMAGAWAVAFLVASALGEWTEPDVILYGPHALDTLQPANFYIKVVISTICMSYGLIFFLLYSFEKTGDAGDPA